MRLLATIVVSISVAFANHEARADFVIRNQPAAASGAGAGPARSPVAPGVVADGPRVDRGESGPPTRPRPIAIRPGPVEGFGDRVPLSFACRQIVPRNIEVGYGPGVDPGTPVSWKGGETWRLVLGRAIAPLGLRMVAAGMRLTIEQ